MVKINALKYSSSKNNDPNFKWFVSGGVIQPLIDKTCARSLIAHLGLKNDLKASKKIFGLIFNGQTTKFKTFKRLSEYK